jgi:hypothetical protein
LFPDHLGVLVFRVIGVPQKTRGINFEFHKFVPEFPLVSHVVPKVKSVTNGHDVTAHVVEGKARDVDAHCQVKAHSHSAKIKLTHHLLGEMEVKGL